MRGGLVYGGIGVDETTMVGMEQVAALGLGNRLGQLALRFGEEGADAGEEPVDLASAAEEDAAQH